jgi:DNA-directed RNA polymerase specialized sigma24 family protein
MPGPDPRLEPELLAAAQRGDAAAFERLLAPHRRALYAHCYRLLGSVQDAEDALQEALLGAWRGLAPFEGRSSLRSWSNKIAEIDAFLDAQLLGRLGLPAVR